MWARIRDNMIWELLGIAVDNELKFDEHLTNVSIKAKKNCQF